MVKKSQTSFEKISKENLELREAVERRTIELENKNRELEIESSLEGVRTVAMSMNKPDDMLLVCRIISEQLAILGVKEIRNVQTAIFYVSRGTYMNYEYYAKHKKTFITETIYTNHKIAKAFAAKMLKGKGEISITRIKGKKVKDWLAYQKTTNVFIDRFLEKASSLNYYWHSLGPVALGISTYVPLRDDELKLFQRFLKVFELSYTRYLDIEQAIAQAREAQIEVSLEKVRAGAMSMYKPGDLLNICEILFKEFHALGFGEMRNAMINIHNDDNKTFVNYDYSDEIGKSITPLFYNIHPLIEKQIKEIRSADDAFSETVFKGNDLKEWKKFRKERGEKDDPRTNNISGLYYYFYSIGTGSIGISTFGPISEEKLELLKRFRNVFNLAYQRYADIAQAEAQAKEAKIEASLERMRAVAMSMRKSEELITVCEAMYKELTALGFTNIRNAQISIKDHANQSYFVTEYSDHAVVAIQEAPFDSSPIVKGIYDEMERSKDAFYQKELSGKEFEDWRTWRMSIDTATDKRILSATSMCFYLYSTGEGYLGISTFNAITKYQVEILKRFKNVFELCYRRYIDVAKAEAQAREAKIEAALEKVRSRSLAMHKSED